MRFITQQEVLALGVGLAVGLPVGALLLNGTVSDGMGIILAAVVGVAGVGWQIRAGSELAAASRAADWLHRRQRVADILIAELAKLVIPFRTAVRMKEMGREGLQRLLDLQTYHRAAWEKRGGKGEYPAYKTTRYYFPHYGLRYFKDNQAALECLPPLIISRLSRLLEDLEQLHQLAREEISVDAALAEYDGHLLLLEKHYKRITKFMKAAHDFRNGLVGQSERIRLYTTVKKTIAAPATTNTPTATSVPPDQAG